MAYPTTLVDWIALIKSQLDIEDLTNAQLQTSFDLAQSKLNRELRSQWMLGNTSYAWVLAVNNIDLLTVVPDLNEIFAILIGSNTVVLEGLSIFEYYQYASTSNPTNVNLPISAEFDDIPHFYSIFGSTLYIWPYPGDTAIVNIMYYKEIPLIGSVGSENSNVFSLKHPDLLLLAALVEANTFIVEDERNPIFEAKYMSRLEAYNLSAINYRLGATPRARRIPDMGMR